MKKERMFTRENNKAVIRSDSKTQKIEYDNRRSSYKAVQSRGKVIIYQVFRREKPKKIRSYKSKNLESSINRFKSEKEKIQIKETYKTNKVLSTEKTYQNFKPTKNQINGKNKKIILQMLCFCVAPRAHIQDHIVGYSKTFNGRGKKDFIIAEQQAIKGARAGFINKYHNRLSSGSDIIISEVDRRYIIYKTNIRRTKLARELEVS